MITVERIKNSITKMLYDGTKLKVYGERNEKQLDKPCLCVDIIPIGSTKLNKSITNNSILIDIVYLTIDSMKIDNYKMIDVMKIIFDYCVIVEDRHLTIMELDFNIIDNVLHTQFKLNYFGQRNLPAEEQPITEIKMNLNMKNGE